MSKPSRSFPRPLSELLSATLSDALKAQGFASTEIISRWTDIVGPEIAAHSETAQDQLAAPRSAMKRRSLPRWCLRVEGPAALEIQHLSAVILERVNRFFGWQAIGRIATSTGPAAAPRAAVARTSPMHAAAAHRRRSARHQGRRPAPGAGPAGCSDQAKLTSCERLGTAGRAIATIVLIQLASHGTSPAFQAQESHFADHPPRILPEHGRPDACHRRAWHSRRCHRFRRGVGRKQCRLVN